MMQFRFAAGALAAGLMLAGAAHAQTSGRPVGRLTHLQAGSLLRMCQAPQGVKSCEGYISGISDGITLVESAAGPEVARKVCIPAVPGTQLRAAVVGWLSKHNERLSSDVGPAVFDALASAYPCDAGAGGKP